MRLDRVMAGVFVVLVSTAIIGFSAGNTGASFTGTTTNPGQILNTQSVTPPASFTSATSAVAGRIDLVWTASTSPAGGHTLTYLVYRGPVGGPYATLVGSTAGLTMSDTPGADGSYQYVVQTKIAQGAGFFTSGNSATKNGLSDRVAPAMSILCNGGACGGWKTSSAVSVTGADGGSGMASVTYNIDAAANVVTNAATASFNPTDGTHTINYFGADVAGNVQGTAAQTVKIDTVAPTAATAVTGAPGQQNGQIDLTWTKGTDATSGVSGYTIHGTNPLGAAACPATLDLTNYPVATAVVGNVAAKTLTLVTGKSYCFYLTTTDVAGNTSGASNRTAKVTAN